MSGREARWSTAFYPDGKLKTCWLAEDSEIGGIPCMQAGFTADVFGGGVEVDFHENGRLKTCKLSREWATAGRTIPRGEHVRFDSEGKLINSD